MSEISIVEIDENHPAWTDFLAVVASLGEVETHRIALQEDYFLSSHILVAFAEDTPIGYLRFVVQQIGEAEDRPLVKFDGRVLDEAKVITFAVLPAHQNRGVGRVLQQAAMAQATGMGCYQFRSRSQYRYAANHHLKISLGFGIQPSLQDDSLYFVMPLQNPVDR